jgi:hypothetical protein
MCGGEVVRRALLAPIGKRLGGSCTLSDVSTYCGTDKNKKGTYTGKCLNIHNHEPCQTIRAGRTYSTTELEQRAGQESAAI